MSTWNSTVFLSNISKLLLCAANSTAAVNENFALLLPHKVADGNFNLIAYNSSILIIGVVLNISFFILWKKKRLASLDTFITLQILIANFMGLIIQFLVSTSLLVGTQLLLEPRWCIVHGFLANLALHVRRAIGWAFGMDRLNLFLCPSKLYKKYRKAVVGCILVFVWLFSFAISTASLPGLLDCYSQQQLSAYTTCISNAACSDSCLGLEMSIFFVLDVLMFVFPLLCYLLTQRKARKFQTTVRPSKENTMKKIKRANRTAMRLYATYFVFVLLKSVTPLMTGAKIHFALTPEFQVFSSFLVHFSSLIYIAESVIILPLESE